MHLKYPAIADGERITISPGSPLGHFVSLAVEQPDLDVDGRLTTGQQAIFRVIFGP